VLNDNHYPTYNTIEFRNASSCIFHCGHFDEPKSPGTVGLGKWREWHISRSIRYNTYPLIVYDGNFFNPPKPAKFFVQVTFLGADAQTKYTKYVGWVRRLLSLVSMRDFDLKKKRSGQTIGAWGGLLGWGDLRRDGGLR
jgi:hypothetical protein